MRRQTMLSCIPFNNVTINAYNDPMLFDYPYLWLLHGSAINSWLNVLYLCQTQIPIGEVECLQYVSHIAVIPNNMEHEEQKSHL
jgi:hypothetical protein